MDENKIIIEKEEEKSQYLKLNSNSFFELLSDKDYSKELSNFPKIFVKEENINEEKITRYLNSILPESKESDLLKLNFALSSGCKRNKNNSQKCLNEIMNMKETSNLILTYSSIKTYEELVAQAKEFQIKGSNIINKFMVEKKDEEVKSPKKFLFKKKERNSDVKTKKEFNNSSENLPKIKSMHQNQKTLVFEFKDIKSEKKRKLPSEMRCLIKKFTTVKNLKLLINNNNKTNQDTSEEYNLDITDIQNIIIILFNTEWLFQNLLEIEIDLSNYKLYSKQLNIQNQKLKILSDILKTEKKLSVYHSGLNKSVIFNPYQLSNFYSSFPKIKKDKIIMTKIF